MPEISKKLERLGLHKNEIIVYLALLELGQSRAATIIDRTKLHRNLVYTSLDELADKKLITKMEKGKVAVFEANDPSALKEQLVEKMETAESTVNELRALMTGKPRDIRIYEGTEGTIIAREKVAHEITPGEKYYVMGVSYTSANEKLEHYFPKLNRQIIQKGGDIKVLVAGNEDPKIITNRGLTWEQNARYLPFDIRSPMWMTMFRDVLNISIVGADPITFSIRSTEAAEGFKKYFEYFWNQPVRMTSGREAVQTAFEQMLKDLSPGEEYYVLGTALIGKHSEYDRYLLAHHTARIAKGVHAKLLSYKEDLNKIQNSFTLYGDQKGEYSQTKPFFSAPPIPMQINLYKNKTQMIFTGDQPTVFYFDQPEVFQGFKKYFDEMWNQRQHMLTGEAGLRELCDLTYAEGKDLYVISATGEFPRRFRALYEEFHKKRAARKIKIHILTNNNYNRDSEALLAALPLSENKRLPDGFLSPMGKWIFGGKVAIIVWDEPLTILLIDDPKIAQYHHEHYLALAKMATKDQLPKTQ